MATPSYVPGPAAGPAGPARRSAARATAPCLAVAGVTVLLGVVAGFLWAAFAPRPVLVMSGPGAASLLNPETSAFIAADGWYIYLGLAGGALAGLVGYLTAVRRHGPVAMLTVLVSALAAGLVALWIGTRPGLARYHHLLATLPAGAHLHAALTLRATTAIAFWPLAAGLVAGLLELMAWRQDRRPATGSALAAD